MVSRPAQLLRATVAAAAALALAACGASSTASTSADSPSAPGRNVGTRTDIPLPAAVAKIPFRDAHGRTHTLASFRGKVLVISDSMTLCQETCPLDTASLVQTAHAVDRAGLRDKVELLTITVDPQRDTPPQLAAYRKLYAPAPANWLTFTASPSEVSKLWHTLGVYRKVVPEGPGKPPRSWRTGKPLTYDVEHSDEVFFFGTDQHEKFILDGTPHVAGKSAIPKTLYQFMSKNGHDNVLHPKATAWTVPQALQAVGWLAHHRIGS